MNPSFERSSVKLSRRCLLAQGSIALAGHAAIAYGRPLADLTEGEFVEVNTAFGRLRGVSGKGSGHPQRNLLCGFSCWTESFKGGTTTSALVRRARCFEIRHPPCNNPRDLLPGPP